MHTRTRIALVVCHSVSKRVRGEWLLLPLQSGVYLWYFYSIVSIEHYLTYTNGKFFLSLLLPRGPGEARKERRFDKLPNIHVRSCLCCFTHDNPPAQRSRNTPSRLWHVRVVTYVVAGERVAAPMLEVFKTSFTIDGESYATQYWTEYYMPFASVCIGVKIYIITSQVTPSGVIHRLFLFLLQGKHHIG